MKKKLFRFLTVVLAFSIMTTVLSGVAFADHEYGDIGNPYIRCSYEGIRNLHTGPYDSTQDYGTHTVSYGTCYKSIMLFYHAKQCALCYHTFNPYMLFGCRVTHTYCPTEYLGNCVNN